MSKASRFLTMITVIVITVLVATVLPVFAGEEENKIEMGFSYYYDEQLFSLDSITIAGVSVQKIEETTSGGRRHQYEVILTEDTEDDVTINLCFNVTSEEPTIGPLIMDKSIAQYAQSVGCWGGVLGYTNAMNDGVHGNIASKGKTVILKEGYGDAVIYCYTYPNEEVCHPYIAFIHFRKENKEPCSIEDYELVSEGQFMYKEDLLNAEQCARLVVPYETDSATLEFEKSGPCEAYVDGKKAAAQDETQWNCTLSASGEGDTHSIELQVNGSTIHSYQVVCYTAQYSGMPDKVVEYICPYSQYTNNGTPANVPYANMYRAVATLRGGNNDATGELYDTPVSLGNLGGYITYYYDDAVEDDPSHPYGIDFIINGNAASGNSGFAEPGNVTISEDGQTWYKLAGSLHYDSVMEWNQTIEYNKNAEGNTDVSINGNSITDTLKKQFPSNIVYPLFDWDASDYSRITVTTDRIRPQEGTNEYGNTIPTYPAFGYVDCGKRDTTNHAPNPYSGLSSWGESGRVDGFDLAWAVDDEGRPVKLENGIHYIKITTATMIDGGAIGEKSTELNMIRKATGEGSSVGITTAPASILIDGTEFTGDALKPFELLEANAEGIFDIKVNAMKNANVYINSLRGDTAFFEKADHGIIRIIVQEGQKAPLIYYFQIRQSPQPQERPVTKVLLQSKGSYLKTERKKMLNYYDADTLAHQADENGEIPFPEPVFGHSSTVQFVFHGYADEEGNNYSGFRHELLSSEGGEITLTENTEQIPVGDGETIQVSMRLIGSTLSEEKVDLSEKPMDTEYQTWYATRVYEMEYGSTVYDLFIKAMEQSGLRQVGADSNYVSAIYAPDELDGYKLAEMTNGPFSGWMYTLNGRHANAMKDEVLEDGDEVVWHYVNDYRYEVEDWSNLGGEAFPQLGTDTSLMNLWLAAEDIDPAEKIAREEQEKKEAEEAKRKEEEARRKAEEARRKAEEAKKEKEIAGKLIVSLRSVKAKKRTITVKWKKVASAKGYQIQYARDQKFRSSAAQKNVTKYPGKGFKLKNLKAKKKYFVRIRAYTVYNGKTIYGPWSSAKKVKTRK